MCGRFNMIDDPLTQLLMQITGGGDQMSITTAFNIAPTEQIPVLRQVDSDWSLDPMRWWLVPYWSDGPNTKYSMFNAKSETLSKSRAYRESFKRKRCLIPASGYYEWKKEGGVKVPYYIEPDDAPGFAFAGLWDKWQSREEGGETIVSCTIVTAAAPVEMQQVHHRIPVHLTVDEAQRWVQDDCSQDELTHLLRPEIRGDIRITPVSTIVNNARNKDPRCVEPLGETVFVKNDPSEKH